MSRPGMIWGKRVNSYEERDAEHVCYWEQDVLRIKVWYLTVPKDGKEFYGNLANHDVVEHEDGTITVSPSIKIWNHEGEVHGFLVRGVWEDA